MSESEVVTCRMILSDVLDLTPSLVCPSGLEMYQNIMEDGSAAGQSPR